MPTADLQLPPARILSPVGDEIRTALLTAAEAGDLDDFALAWLEKVRRFASYSGRNLRLVAKGRFGREAETQLGWMGRFLIAGAKCHPQKGGAPFDQACLSAALFCASAKRSDGDSLELLIRRALDDIRAALLLRARVDSPPALGGDFGSNCAQWRREAAGCGPVVLFSPNPYSLYSIAVLELCLRYKLPVAALVLRSFSANRLLQEWRRDGLRLPRKIWRKLILRADENAATAGLSLKKLVDDFRPQYRDIRKSARANGIPVILASEFSDLENKLRPLNPEFGLFTGGGMIGSETIDCFSRGIINVHFGPLPHYKGMDVVEAPLLELRDRVGATAHLMVPKLDAGPVLLRLCIDPDDYRHVGDLRNSIACMAPLVMFDSVLGSSSGRVREIEQTVAGRQFFILHPRLKALLHETFSLRNQEVQTVRTRLEACLENSLREME